MSVSPHKRTHNTHAQPAVALLLSETQSVAKGAAAPQCSPQRTGLFDASAAMNNDRSMFSGSHKPCPPLSPGLEDMQAAIVLIDSGAYINTMRIGGSARELEGTHATDSERKESDDADHGASAHLPTPPLSLSLFQPTPFCRVDGGPGCRFTYSLMYGPIQPLLLFVCALQCNAVTSSRHHASN